MAQMNDYAFADLREEDVDQIRLLEERLRQSSGHAITLIAFESADRTERPSAES